jgi:hypothetical protein
MFLLLMSSAALPKPRTFRRCILYSFMCECSDGCRRSEARLTHAPNIFAVGYEFEGDETAIS